MNFSPRSSSLSSRSSLTAMAEEADSPDSIKVEFDPDPVITGFTLPLASSTISRDVTATITPTKETKNIKFSVIGEVRVTIIEKSRDNATGKVVLTVKGTSATPADKKDGDTQIIAKKDEIKVGEVNAIVKVPKAIGRPHPEIKTPAEAGVTPTNMALSRSTSPAYWPPLPAGQVHLCTVFEHILAIPVDDQFGKRLDALYAGVVVEETHDGTWLPINQTMKTDGTYLDPVGQVTDKTPGPADVPAGSPTATNWPTDPTGAIPVGTVIQALFVAVGGHPLSPSISNRRVVTAPPANVFIFWR